jgi:uncharacterized protein DUF4124
MIPAERTSTMRITAPALVLVTAVAGPLAAASALADTIYKWVDDQGTVHYSNARPADATRRPEIVSEDRVSVIQSEPPAVRAAAAARAETAYLNRRIQNLEYELAAQRQAAAAYAAADAAQYDQGSYAPYPVVLYPGRIIAGHRVPLRGSRSMSRITGVTAGNVVTFASQRGGRTFRR